ncbi:Serine-rich protein [Zostera marina]|uniref:Serine-rich protein n=1 Tax=Zostera marina TaxID=29655 RepID=A0A0K9P7L3_ZOSMR|nr:Serine-rich protein [Zostera marina]
MSSSTTRNVRSGGGVRLMTSTCRHHQHSSQSPSYSYYYYASSSPSSSPFASSMNTSFGSPVRSVSSSSFHHRQQHLSSHQHNQHSYKSQGYARSSSPTRVNFVGSGSISSPPSVRFSVDARSMSPNRSLTSSIHHHHHLHHHQTHHHHPQAHHHPHSHHHHHHQRIPQQQRRTCMCSPTTHPGSFRCSLHKNTACQTGGRHNLSAPSNRLNAMRSAMTKSSVKVGTVEGELAKRTLAALIRRASFQPRPSRLSVMCMATEDDNVDDGDTYL